jgi:ATP-binding cassette subfamily F protein 3
VCSSLSDRSRAARRRGWCWRWSASVGRICCCSTSRPITSISKCVRRAVADELILVDAGRAAPFDGDLEDYARWFLTAAEPAQEAESTAKPAAEQKKQRKREEAERRNRLSPLRADVARCEARIAELEQRRQEIEAQLANPEIYGEQAKQRLQELLKSQTELRRDLQAGEDAWVAASERLDAELAASSE